MQPQLVWKRVQAHGCLGWGVQQASKAALEVGQTLAGATKASKNASAACSAAARSAAAAPTHDAEATARCSRYDRRDQTFTIKLVQG